MMNPFTHKTVDPDLLLVDDLVSGALTGPERVRLVMRMTTDRKFDRRVMLRLNGWRFFLGYWPVFAGILAILVLWHFRIP